MYQKDLFSKFFPNSLIQVVSTRLKSRGCSRQRCKKRQIWQTYLCYSFQGGANFWTMHRTWTWTVSTVLLGLWYQHCGHSTDQYNDIRTPTKKFNNWIWSIQTMLNIIAMLINLTKYLLNFILQNISLL